jgi:hypothetical protein
MSVLAFDEERHEYRLDGRRLPSVTEILKPLYGDLRFVREDILEYKRALGSAVHTAIDLHIKGGLLYSSLEGPVAEYFEQYLLWELESGFKPIESEARVHSALGYAGTLDLFGQIGKKLVLADTKCTAALSPAVALQTAAYRKAYAETRGIDEREISRAALRLAAGKYHYHPYKAITDASDFGAFLGLLKIAQWCRANGAELSEVAPHV